MSHSVQKRCNTTANCTGQRLVQQCQWCRASQRCNHRFGLDHNALHIPIVYARTTAAAAQLQSTHRIFADSTTAALSVTALPAKATLALAGDGRVRLARQRSRPPAHHTGSHSCAATACCAAANSACCNLLRSESHSAYIGCVLFGSCRLATSLMASLHTGSTTRCGAVRCGAVRCGAVGSHSRAPRQYSTVADVPIRNSSDC